MTRFYHSTTILQLDLDVSHEDHDAVGALVACEEPEQPLDEAIRGDGKGYGGDSEEYREDKETFGGAGDKFERNRGEELGNAGEFERGVEVSIGNKGGPLEVF